MRVAHIILSLGYGGIETMVVNIANAQAHHGANVCVMIINDLVASELRERFLPQVVVVQIGRRLGSRNIQFLEKLGHALDDMSPDVIHLHGSALYDFLPRRWRNNLVCSTLHAMPHGSCGMAWRVGRLTQRLLLHKGGNVMNINRMKQVFSISNAVRSALLDEYCVDSTVICNGIQADIFSKRSLIIPRNGFKIVLVGRLEHEKKGQDLLIDAIAKLAAKQKVCQVALIGEGASRAVLEEMVVSRHLQTQIIFLGTKSQSYLADHLCDYDLFIQPSRYEGFGLTVAEAMAAQVPVIVSSGQGPEEITLGETYGLVFRNGDVEDLTSKIEYAIDNYEECLKKVVSARAHVEKCYDVSVTAKKYLDAYNESI